MFTRALAALTPLLLAGAALAADGDGDLGIDDSTIAALIAFIVVTIVGTMTAFTLCVVAPWFAVMSIEGKLGKSPLILAGVMGAVAAMNLFFLVDDTDTDNHRFVAWSAVCVATTILLAVAPFAPRLPAAVGFGGAAALTLGGLGFSLTRASDQMGDALFGQGAVEGGALYIAVVALGFALYRRRSLGMSGIGVATLLGVLPLVAAWFARPLGY
jgi:hypothetical protein